MRSNARASTARVAIRGTSLVDLREERRRAEKAIEEYLKLHYPPDTEFVFRWGEHIYHGRCVLNCYGDRMKVRNIRTGKTRFIDSSHIIENSRGW